MWTQGVQDSGLLITHCQSLGIYGPICQPPSVFWLQGCLLAASPEGEGGGGVAVHLVSYLFPEPGTQVVALSPL